jgi:Protein of unknown function (DUF2934)
VTKAPKRPSAVQTPASDPVSSSDRYRQISLCAYFKAEKRGFAPGHTWDDWLAAEREINDKFAQRGSREPSPRDP